MKNFHNIKKYIFFNSYKAFLGLIGILFSSLIYSNDLIKKDALYNYVVQENDTILDIFEKYFTPQWLWKKIWHLNPNISNSNLIGLGDTIQIISVSGDKRPTVQRNNNDQAMKIAPYIKKQKLPNNIPSISLNKIHSLLTKHIIIENRNQIDKLSIILSNTKKRSLTTLGDEVYLKNTSQYPIGQKFNIYRISQKLIKNNANYIYGILLMKVGELNLNKKKPYSIGKITKSNSEILNNDILIAFKKKDNFEQLYLPKPYELDITATVLAILNSYRIAGKNNSIIINAGMKDSLEIGHVLSVQGQNKDYTNNNPKQIPLDKGKIMIYKTYNHFSFAFILQSQTGISVGDTITKVD